MPPHASATASDSSSTDSPRPPPKLYTIRGPPLPGSDRHSTDAFDLTLKHNGTVPIVIDNGSWQTRAGFAHDPKPRLMCPPVVSRYLDRKVGKKYLFGGYDVNVDATARGHVKTVFDGNIVSNFDALEMLLDYTFIRLGLEGDQGGGLGHPLVMTEAVCNPSYSRRMVSELIFEAYNAPALTYGIDALFSYSYNGGRDGLVVSSGNTSTHMIPVLNGRGITSMTTRLNWGGAQGTDLMLKLLQLKYPTFPAKLQTWHAEALVMDHCYISSDYREEMKDYLKPEVLEEKDRVVQFPFTETVVVEKTQEELNKIAEKRKESGRRLQEQAAKMRLEKLIKKEQELEYYRELQTKGETLTKRDFKRLLESNDLDSEQQLEKVIADLDRAIKRGRKQDLGDEKESDEPPSFPLLDVPDEELDDEGKKQKRLQRLMKSNHDARQRARAEKEAEKARIEEEQRKDVEFRESNLEEWVNVKRAARETLVQKLKDRQRVREELTDRKSLASRIRMESIANLASDNPSAKKRRRGGTGGTNTEADDGFGANDDDWSVYRSIGTGGTGGDEMEEEEEELNRELKSIEAALLEHDPDFEDHHTREAQSDWSKSLLHAFFRGTRPFNPDSQHEQNQLHLNVERIRVPEVVFEPSMAGLDQAGIIEIASDILTHRISSPEQREALLRDVYLTGGNTAFMGFDERLKRELTAVMPAGIAINIRRAKDPCLDAWYGAAQWCGKPENDAEWRRAVVTREEWLEKGADYIKEHRLGNAFS